MNIIELAAQRFQELSRAGANIEPPVSGRAGGAQRVGTMAGIHKSSPGQGFNEPMDCSADDGGTVEARRPSRHSESVTLDIDRLEQSGVLVATRSRSTMAEEFRHIKQPLLANARNASSPQQRKSLIMVTSALPGEGKTFCSINLALSMAMEVDKSVLLVDADVVRCSLMSMLGLEPRRGLLDVLTNPQLDLSEVLLKTNVPRLSLLPAGTSNVRSTELLGSDAMDKLLGELSSRYPDRIVVFDTTPLLLTSEAKVLALGMGQIVVVVEEGKTTYESLEKAFTAVETCPSVMSVLNKGRQAVSNYASYYG